MAIAHRDQHALFVLARMAHMIPSPLIVRPPPPPSKINHFTFADPLTKEDILALVPMLERLRKKM